MTQVHQIREVNCFFHPSSPGTTSDFDLTFFTSHAGIF